MRQGLEHFLFLVQSITYPLQSLEHFPKLGLVVIRLLFQAWNVSCFLVNVKIIVSLRLCGLTRGQGSITYLLSVDTDQGPKTGLKPGEQTRSRRANW